MNREQIVAEIKTFLETEFPNDGVTLTETTDLLEEWLSDSLALTEIVVFAAAITGVMLPVDAGWCAATPYRSYTGGLPWE